MKTEPCTGQGSVRSEEEKGPGRRHSALFLEMLRLMPARPGVSGHRREKRLGDTGGEGTAWLSASILNSCGGRRLFDPTGQVPQYIHLVVGCRRPFTARGKVRIIAKSLLGALTFSHYAHVLTLLLSHSSELLSLKSPNSWAHSTTQISS